MSTPATINGKEVFDLLRDDLAAIEREFGRDTVAGVEAIPRLANTCVAAAGSASGQHCCFFLQNSSIIRVAALSVSERWSRSSTPPPWCTTTLLTKPRFAAVVPPQIRSGGT